VKGIRDILILFPKIRRNKRKKRIHIHIKCQKKQEAESLGSAKYRGSQAKARTGLEM